MKVSIFSIMLMKLRKIFVLLIYLLLMTSLINGIGYSSLTVHKAKTQKKVIKTYYARHLKYLREAVKPRFINYVDSSNYQRFGKLLVEGLLFTVKATSAKKVYLVSSIDRYRRHKMVRNSKGVWYLLLEIPSYNFIGQSPSQIKYKFLVDGLFRHDKTHKMFVDDNSNGLISIYFLDKKYIQPKKGVIKLGSNLKYGKKVLFRIYAPSASHISLIGNFNNWNPNIDVLKKNEDGYFELEKKVAPGKHIYQYRVDGENRYDKNNNQLKFHKIFGSVSYFLVK